MSDMMTKMTIKFQLRADPLTIQKLELLSKLSGDNRSEVIRRLIDQAAGTATQQPKPVKAMAD